MELTEHAVQAFGPAVKDGRPKPEAAGSILRLLGPAARGATSMGFRHASRVRGRPPAWLQRAYRVRFIGIAPGAEEGTVFRFVAPSFRTAAPEVYEQRELVQLRPDPDKTALDLLGLALIDLAEKRPDSERYDVDLLRRLERFAKGSFKGVESLTFGGGNIGEGVVPILSGSLAQAAADLCRETPSPNRARVTGKLDMIRHHDRVFALLLQDGVTVQGIWLGDDLEVLRSLFGKDVAVEGKAVYRASGSLLRIDAEAMRKARAPDNAFAVLPQPTMQATDVRQLHQPQFRGQGASALYGRWPGEETEEQILEALRELR